MVWLQVAGFALGSLVLLGISWRVLKNTRSHGFYRFLAWEAMLGLLVLNAPVWFEDRYALHQRVSWVLLFASLSVLFCGIYQLRRDGKPSEQRQDDELYAFERTSQLVTGGIYRFIRHPLFSDIQISAQHLANFAMAWYNRLNNLLKRTSLPGGFIFGGHSASLSRFPFCQ